MDHLSMYFGVADSENLPNGWSIYAQFTMSLVNQINAEDSVTKGTLFSIQFVPYRCYKMSNAGIKSKECCKFFIAFVEREFYTCCTALSPRSLHDCGRLFSD